MSLDAKKHKMITASAETAESIHGEDFDEAWHALQLDFWLLARHTMQTVGYDKLRRRLPNISEECAELLASMSPSDVAKSLCNGTFSTVMPAMNSSELMGVMRAKMHGNLAQQKLKNMALTLRTRKVQSGHMR